MMPQLQVKGVFEVHGMGAGESLFPNQILPAGIQRILELMGGQSAQRWTAIRLVGADPQTQFVQKAASTAVRTGHLESKALFTANELTFDAVHAEMYSGQTLVAIADVEIPSGQTVYVIRKDYLEEVPFNG